MYSLINARTVGIDAVSREILQSSVCIKNSHMKHEFLDLKIS